MAGSCPFPLFVALAVAFAAAHGAFRAEASDFDGDGRADLAIGIPYEDVWAVRDAGAVAVLFGSTAGLTGIDDQLWDEDYLVTADGAEQEDRFGWALATGDFNGDRVSDLAIGVPSEDIGDISTAGVVHVMYGVSGQGPTPAGSQLWHQDVDDIAGVVERLDAFGDAIVAGDFNGDGYDDLAVGVPQESIGSTPSAGAVNVIYGGPSGLSAVGSQLLYEGNNGLIGTAEQSDRFGAELAAGHFNRDGFADLAISIPGEGYEGVLRAGRVVVLYGSPQGLSTGPDQQSWMQGLGGLPDDFEGGDKFGEVLSAGDFNGDDVDDLAVGIPWETANSTQEGIGAVQVIFGADAGLTADGNQLWWDTTPADYDNFGASLTSGDFNDDGCDELAVGIPGETVAAILYAGSVEVLYGTPAGLDRRGGINDVWNLDRDGMIGDVATLDRFGFSLAAGDFDGDGDVDLAVGITGRVVDGYDFAGAVQVLLGSVDGITADGNQQWHQGLATILDVAELRDRFGRSLAASPPERHIFLDGFEAGDTLRWDATQS